MPQKQTEETRKRAELWTNRERVLVLCSRGADVRTRYLMKDIKDLLPHAKGDSKLDQQKSLKALNEIAEMKNCTKVMYFESRKRKDTYLWMSNVEKGPSIKFLVHNVHTMKELKMSGNCLKASRPVLSFDDAFEQKPHLKLIKEVLMQVIIQEKLAENRLKWVKNDPKFLKTAYNPRNSQTTVILESWTLDLTQDPLCNLPGRFSSTVTLFRSWVTVLRFRIIRYSRSLKIYNKSVEIGVECLKTR